MHFFVDLCRGMKIMFLVSEKTLSRVYHDSTRMSQPFSEEELDALRQDEATSSVFEDRGTVREKIAELFEASYSGTITPEQFSDQYGVWIRIRKFL